MSKTKRGGFLLCLTWTCVWSITHPPKIVSVVNNWGSQSVKDASSTFGKSQPQNADETKEAPQRQVSQLDIKRQCDLIFSADASTIQKKLGKWKLFHARWFSNLNSHDCEMLSLNVSLYVKEFCGCVLCNFKGQGRQARGDWKGRGKRGRKRREGKGGGEEERRASKRDERRGDSCRWLVAQTN